MYVQTNEIHTSLDTLVNANSILQDHIKDIEEVLNNAKDKLQQYKKQFKENEKNIKKHILITENRHKHCVECGYVEAKIED